MFYYNYQTLVIVSDETSRDEKAQYYVNRETAKILALSSDEIDNPEYLRSVE